MYNPLEDEDIAMRAIEIDKFDTSQIYHADDVVAIEEPLEIRIAYTENGIYVSKNISITMRTPGDDTNLAIGFLFTEGIINDISQIETSNQLEENIIEVRLNPFVSLDLSKLDRHSYTSSSCGVCGKTSIDLIHIASSYSNVENDFSIPINIFQNLNKELLATQTIFSKTGGIHAAALYDSKGNLVHLAEDVGRHNALDKLIGYCFSHLDFPLKDKFLLVSGRASFELIQKATMAAIPIFLAVGAPSSLAIELANSTHMCLVGFLKSDSFNIYTRPERIIHEK
jgi:FdhD protein